MTNSFQNLPNGKSCFCGGHLKFTQMMVYVGALLCDETENEDQGRQSRLFFPGGMGTLPGLFQPTAAPTVTPATTSTFEASTIAPTTALEAMGQLLDNNIMASPTITSTTSAAPTTTIVTNPTTTTAPTTDAFPGQ